MSPKYKETVSCGSSSSRPLEMGTEAGLLSLEGTQIQAHCDWEGM